VVKPPAIRASEGTIALAPSRYLGFDLSTQSLTAVLIDPSEGVIQDIAIRFDETYPAYATRGGVIIGDDPTLVHADPRMWVEALDDMLGMLKASGRTATVRAIGVSAQQHGTVYLNAKAFGRLSSPDPDAPLSRQLGDIFSRPTSPVWMDSSTHTECAEITEALGGDAAVAALTGSKATERFAGPQIRKFWKQQPQDYARTAHIALISSFVTALLIGRPAPLDAGDGFGTNLADIRNGRWSEAALSATAPGLGERLPALKRKDEVIGRVSGYLVRRYGFAPGTAVIVGSGDNPCSLVGTGLIGNSEKRAISLGTSDTFFGYLPDPVLSDQSEGHIFGTADGRYMALLCFKNGSLARERIRDRFGLSWQDFSEILLRTAPGNGGRVMLPYLFPEITPLVLKPGLVRFGGLWESDPPGNVRAVAEAQIAAMHLHSAWMGVRPQRILVTAGGSENRGLLKLIADMFNAEVRSFEVKDSAALGAAIRAAHCLLGMEGSPVAWAELSAKFVGQEDAVTIRPDARAAGVYQGRDGFLSVYAACEKYGLGQGEAPDEIIARFRRAFPCE